ncbi:hypothetical protein [Halocola ammonii]
MKYFTTLFFFIALTMMSVQGQSENDTIPNSNSLMKHSLGATAARANGVGLTYRYWPGNFGVQATFGPYLEDDLANISAGITFLYRIAGTEHVELFAYQGNHYRFEEYYEGFYSPGPPYHDDKLVTEENFNTGIGLGVEFIILKQINLDLMLGYTAIDNFTGLTITGGAGLYYNF